MRARLGEMPLDPHVLPQHWHLCNVVYDRVFPLDALHDGMTQIVGLEPATRFFERSQSLASKRIRLKIDDALRSTIAAIYEGDYKMIARIA